MSANLRMGIACLETTPAELRLCKNRQHRKDNSGSSKLCHAKMEKLENFFATQ